MEAGVKNTIVRNIINMEQYLFIEVSRTTIEALHSMADNDIIDLHAYLITQLLNN